MFVTLREIGLYSVGASFGLAMKLFLQRVRERVGAVLLRDDEGARRASARSALVTTYGLAVLVLLAAGLAAAVGATSSG